MNAWWNFSTCFLCESVSDSPHGICPPCYQRLPRMTKSCPMCAAPTPAKHVYCAQCLQTPKPYQRSLIPSPYRFPVSQLIQQFKFQDRFHHIPVLAQLLIDHIEAQSSTLPDCLVPVPLHPKRIRERGFNQSVVLCKILGKHFKLPLSTGVSRIVHTQPQSVLPAKLRTRNVRHAFHVAPHFRYNHVAIVDDVVTTTSTVTALALTLKTAGVQRIDVWAIARPGK